MYGADDNRRAVASARMRRRRRAGAAKAAKAKARNMRARPDTDDMAAGPTGDIDAMEPDELRAALDELGITYHHRSGRAKLAGQLREAMAGDDLSG